MTVLGRLVTFGVAILATTGAVAVPSSLARSASTIEPKITARPARVMVSSATSLTGVGFSANTQLQLRECGRVFWIAPEKVCNTGNAITVETNRFGRFKASFHVELCPEGTVGKHPTERTCYIGPVQFGEDTGELQPAVRIVVTYP
jgi:hypothetical protein